MFEPSQQEFTRQIVQFAEAHPNKIAFRFLNSEGVESATASYGQLVSRALQIARALQDDPSQYVLLFYAQGVEFIAAFLAVMFSGRVPVPVFAPSAYRDNFSRMTSIAADCKASLILTDQDGSDILDSWRHRADELAVLKALNTATLPFAPGALSTDDLCEHELAFLQYTSGSTGTPKGVMVSRANLVANLSLLRSFYKKDDKDVFVSWVPVYHDLGLIGNILFPLFLGAECVFMAPETFVRRPSLWLEAISDYRASISFAPTFAYAFTCNYVNRNGIKPIDLSCWDVCVLGAEPIFEQAMNVFHECFKDSGFDKKIFQAAYGLAESTLMVVATPKGEAIRCRKVDAEQLGQGRVVDTQNDKASEFRRVVSSGRAGEGHDVQIRDVATGRILDEREVGEVLLAGPSIASGYHKQRDAAEFALRINDRLYLRTGDAGFLDGGELYITGRLKDVIIVNGVNHYPQDIENVTYAAHPAIRPGCAAAFTLDDETASRLVVVAEAKGDLQDSELTIFDRIAEGISSVFGLATYDICLIAPGSIAKTSSGKIQRQLTKKKYVDGQLKVLACQRQLEVAMRLENWLKFNIAALIRKPIESVRLETSLDSIGLNAEQQAELKFRLREQQGIPSEQLELAQFDSVHAWLKQWVGSRERTNL